MTRTGVQGVPAQDQSEPIDRDAFAAVLEKLLPPDTTSIAVAVSGGTDSMALVLLLHDWCRASGLSLTALTVDHGLRDESANEARQVGEWLGRRGIAHHVLMWSEGPQHRSRTASAQTAARDARYALMTKWCSDHGVAVLCTAHHAEDQVETFLMRLTRGSGLEGLAAIKDFQDLQGLRLVRPLLTFSKSGLAATCKARGQAWVEDSSNQNAKYARTRFRQARSFLAAEGLTDARLLTTIGHLQRAQAAIDAAVADFAARAVAWNDFGVCTVMLEALRAAPAEVGLRTLTQVLCAGSGQDYGPRFEALSHLYERLIGAASVRSTVHGCLVSKSGTVVSIFREAAAVTDEQTIRPNSEIIWDGRFRIAWQRLGDARNAELNVVALRNEHWLALMRRDGVEALAELSPQVRGTVPVATHAGRVVAVPHLGRSFDDRGAVGGTWEVARARTT